MSKRKKGRSRPGDYERLEAPGLTVERSGRFMTFRTHRTPDEQRALNEARQKAFLGLPDKIKTQAQRIEELFSAYNSFDLLAVISLMNLLMIPDTYVESEQKGSSFVVEYATLLLLKEEYRDGVQLISPEAYSEAATLLKTIQDDLVLLAATRSADPEDVGSPSDLEELQVAAEMWELSVRSLAYEHHLRGVLGKLFQPFDDHLVTIVGFGCADALRIISAMETMTSKKLLERAAEARRCRDEITRAVERSRKGMLPPAHLSDLVAALKDLSKKELAERLTSNSFAFVFTVAGNTLSFSAADIVAETSLDELRVGAFLSAFSLTFGDIAPDFYVPTVFHQLKEKPIVRHDETYLCPVPGLLDWAVKPILESALQGTQFWHRYESHRHDFTVREAVRLLGTALPSSEAYTELHYSIGGESLDGELDALLSVDSAVVLLEAKGGAFTPPAKEGKRHRLQRDLGALVAKAHAQANRAYKYLRSADEVFFQIGADDELKLRHANSPHVFLVSVLLEPLGHLTTRQAAGSLLATQGDEHVWTVPLYDLMVIAELAEPFPLILHYILRRVQALKQGLIEAHDELDFFGAYLDSGLFFRGGDFERLDSLTVSTFTDMFDAYFLHQAGKRKKYVKKPAARMSGEFHRFILALGSSGLSRRLDALLHLLDMDGDSRQSWIRGVVEVKRKCRRDSRPHSFTQAMTGKDGFGLVYYCGPEEVDDIDNMEQYIRHKIDETGARGWIAIEDTQRTPGYSFRRILTAGDMVMQYHAPARDNDPTSNA
jgi:hypothetical protein